MTIPYELADVFTVAKRENNTIRPWLFVNPLQGKHIPADPEASLRLFRLLAQKAERRYRGERLLVIGFAETATAIGAAVAWYAGNAAYYMTTTREDLPGAVYLHFTESHSHATDQRIVRNGLDGCLDKVDRIVFAEDELTTGKTIEKCMEELRSAYPTARRFGIVSILNSMSEERLRRFRELDTPCDFLFRIDGTEEAGRLERFRGFSAEQIEPAADIGEPLSILCGDAWEARLATPKARFAEQLRRYLSDALPRIAAEAAGKRVLIVGTEEFMFPGMFLGKLLGELYPDTAVRFHATTRSPILVSGEGGYPLYNRCQLDSLYEAGRRTYLYNLARYDLVVIATDARAVNPAGLRDLTGALAACGNERFILLRWGEGVR